MKQHAQSRKYPRRFDWVGQKPVKRLSRGNGVTHRTPFGLGMHTYLPQIPGQQTFPIRTDFFCPC